MDSYSDYESWKEENFNLIKTLISKQSKTISRFTQVIAVVDYLYEKVTKCNTPLTNDEDVIFEVGFNYIHDNFLTISNLLETTFNNNIDEMEKYSKTINLLLYVNDFENELYNACDNFEDDLKKLEKFEDKVLSYLESKKQAPDEMFALLNDITIPMFDKHNLEINTIEQIFYEIACEYNIYHENDYDSFNKAFCDIIEKNRNIHHDDCCSCHHHNDNENK